MSLIDLKTTTIRVVPGDVVVPRAGIVGYCHDCWAQVAYGCLILPCQDCQNRAPMLPGDTPILMADIRPKGKPISSNKGSAIKLYNDGFEASVRSLPKRELKASIGAGAKTLDKDATFTIRVRHDCKLNEEEFDSMILVDKCPKCGGKPVYQ